MGEFMISCVPQSNPPPHREYPCFSAGLLKKYNLTFKAAMLYLYYNCANRQTVPARPYILAIVSICPSFHDIACTTWGYWRQRWMHSAEMSKWPVENVMPSPGHGMSSPWALLFTNEPLEDVS